MKVRPACLYCSTVATWLANESSVRREWGEVEISAGWPQTPPREGACLTHAEQQSLWVLRQTSQMVTINECHRHSRLLTYASRCSIELLGKSFSNNRLLISIMVGVGTEPWKPKEWVCSLLEALLMPVSYSSCCQDPALLFSHSGSLHDWHLSLKGGRWLPLSGGWDRLHSWLSQSQWHEIGVTPVRGLTPWNLKVSQCPPPLPVYAILLFLSALKSISGLRGRRGAHILFFSSTPYQLELPLSLSSMSQ